MLLGLKTMAIYQRIQSIIVAKTKKQPQDDDRLRSILESSMKKMEEINVVDLNYKKTTYEGWDPVPSGLNSTVKLYAK
jgi:hypothetical protein